MKLFNEGSRVLQLAVAVLLIGVLLYPFKWWSSMFRQQSSNREAAADALVVPSSQQRLDNHEMQPNSTDIASNLVGTSTRTLSSERCESALPSVLFDGMTQNLVSRGFIQISNINAGRSLNLLSSAKGFFWRSKDPFGDEILGINEKTMMSPAPASPLFMTITVGRHTATCGTWLQAYRYDVGKSRKMNPELRGLLDDKLNHPPAVKAHHEEDIPLPSGTVSVFDVAGADGMRLDAFYCPGDPRHIRQWYERMMAGGWISTPIGEIHASAESGLMYFTKAGRYCLILIGDKSHDNNSLVLVSTGKS